MIGKVLLLLRTVRYLKLKQVVYQFYYRLKPYKTLHAYLPVANGQLVFRPLSFSNAFKGMEQVRDERSFTFLNLGHRFPDTVDWDFQGYGKLWNYNLQYFNYFQQEQLSDQVKEVLLQDIGSWLKDGRLKLEPYPVSLRIMNSLRYFSGQEVQNEELIRQTYAELNYLDQHLEFHIMGNHLLENAFALLMGGYAFDNSQWQQKAQQILSAELKEQILQDGAHFELSSMYHQIVLFRVLELIDWYGKISVQDVSFMDFLKEKALRMLNWLQVITFKNGDIPHFSDSAIGIALTSRELFQFADSLNLGVPKTIGLNDSGYRKFSSEDYECVVDVGPVGPSYQPGHSHADALSFILYAQGQPFLVEAGTSTYQIGEKRNYERSTSAHNTVVIQGQNQSQVWGGFRVGRRAKVNLLKETASGIMASHDGYQSVFATIHQRSFTFAADSVRIKDEISGPGNLMAKAYLHFHPDCKVVIREDGSIDIDKFGMVNLKNATDYRLESYDMADGYNRYKKGTVLVVEFQGFLDTMIVLRQAQHDNGVRSASTGSA